MRVCRITRDLDLVIMEHSPLDGTWRVVPLFRGYPGRKVRVARRLLGTSARHPSAAPLAALALRLCRRELAEMVLACDPDALDLTDVPWGARLQHLLQPRFPQWFTGAGPTWRKLDPSATVSIVLPVYNVRPYLHQSVESCLAQTYRNIELIVVDDGSNDDVAAALGDYDDPRIHLLRHDRNRGIAAGLNTGFARAAGSLLTWTSDDNFYHPRAIEEMVSFLQTYQDIDFVYAAMHVIDERLSPEPTRMWEVKPPEWFRARTTNPIGACFMYRRHVYDRLDGYDTGAMLVEDYEYWLRVAGRFRMQRLFTPLYYYRYHDESLTARYDRRDVLARLKDVRRRHDGRQEGLARRARPQRIQR